MDSNSDSNNGMLKRMLKTTTTKIVGNLNRAKAAYVEYVGQNPDTVEQVERTVKAAAYLYEAFSKNYDNSIFVTELVSSACNLFSYVNSHIQKSKDFFTVEKGSNFVEKLNQVLTVIEFSQAFLEIAAVRTGGPGARWAVISVICLVKGGVKISSLSLTSKGASVSSVLQNEPSSSSQESNVFYVGPRTGHKFRTLDSCDDSHSCNKVNVQLPPTALNKTQIVGELLYSVRPMIHLLATAAFGTKSFLPWVTALATDASSHVLLTKENRLTNKKLNPLEEKELQRRYANLLLYLLRSPVFDKTTGPKLLQLFAYLSKNVPLARYIFDPLSKYLPAWQRVYFYTWCD